MGTSIAEGIVGCGGIDCNRCKGCMSGDLVNALQLRAHSMPCLHGGGRVAHGKLCSHINEHGGALGGSGRMREGGMDGDMARSLESHSPWLSSVAPCFGSILDWA